MGAAQIVHDCQRATLRTIQLTLCLPSAASSGSGTNASDSTDIAIAATTAAYTARCASNLAITAATAGYCGLAYTTAAAANAAATAASAAAYGNATAAEAATVSAYDLAISLQNETYGLTPGKSNTQQGGSLARKHRCICAPYPADETCPCVPV